MEDGFHFKESISFLADEPVEKISISEEASDMHPGYYSGFFCFPQRKCKQQENTNVVY